MENTSYECCDERNSEQKAFSAYPEHMTENLYMRSLVINVD